MSNVLIWQLNKSIYVWILNKCWYMPVSISLIDIHMLKQFVIFRKPVLGPTKSCSALCMAKKLLDLRQVTHESNSNWLWMIITTSWPLTLPHAVLIDFRSAAPSNISIHSVDQRQQAAACGWLMLFALKIE